MLRSLSIVATSLLLSSLAAAQSVIIVDHRPDIPIRGSYLLRALEVNANLRDQVAEVQVSQTFYNPGPGTLEAEFLFPLPEDGAVQNLVLLADGKELPGRLLSADEARRIYESIVRAKRDPALLQYVGRGLFKTSVFPIPPASERVVTLRYTQLCRRDRDLVEFNYPLSTHQCTTQPIGKLTINLNIDSKQPIKSIYSPSHQPLIQRSGDTHAAIHLDQQSIVPNSDFRIFYGLSADAVGGTLLSYKPATSGGGGEDGYFMLLASPGFARPDTKPLPKSILFVLDKSGSMAGRKIEQARSALRFVMNNLNEGDTFNIITYDDRVDPYKPELQGYNKESRDAALSWIDSIHAGGSTNIDGALHTAMSMVTDNKRPTYILFLTDGLPTAGETNELRLAENIKAANKANARIIVFGVGFDVNARLLDRISHGNGGVSEYVHPDQDIESSVARLYSRIAAPVLADVKVLIDGVTVNRTYPRDLPDLFEGGQLVYVGRYMSNTSRDREGAGQKAIRATITLTGRVGDKIETFSYPSDFADAETPAYAFVEKIWATRRIGDLIDQIDLHGRSSELVNELVELSKKHGILTPYTAFLAEDRKSTRLNSSHLKLSRMPSSA